MDVNRDLDSKPSCIGRWWADSIFRFKKVIEDKCGFNLGMNILWPGLEKVLKKSGIWSIDASPSSLNR